EFATDVLGLEYSEAQTACIKSMYGMELTKPEREIFRQCTGRKKYVPREYNEITVVAGARSGKDSRILSPCLLYEAVVNFDRHAAKITRGEIPTVALVAQDAKAATIAFSYLRDQLTGSPMLKNMLAEEPLATSLKLTNGVVVTTFPSTLRSMR